MRPALKKMKEKYGETVTFWDIDVDNIDSDALSQKYRVQFIPYMVLLDKEGKTFRILEAENLPHFGRLPNAKRA